MEIYAKEVKKLIVDYLVFTYWFQHHHPRKLLLKKRKYIGQQRMGKWFPLKHF